MSVLKIEVTNKRDLCLTHKEDGRICNVVVNTDNLAVKSALLECGFRQPDHMLNPTQKEVLDKQEERDGSRAPFPNFQGAGYSVNDRRASMAGFRAQETTVPNVDIPDAATCLTGWRGPQGFKLVKAQSGHSCACCGKRIPASARNADIAFWSTRKDRPTDDHQCYWAHPECLYRLGLQILAAQKAGKLGACGNIPTGLTFALEDAKILTTNANLSRLKEVLRETLGREGYAARDVESLIRDSIEELRTLAKSI